MIKSFGDGLLTDLLGGPYRTDPEVQALAYAIRAGTQLLIKYTDNATVMGAIEKAPEEALDLLAAELRTQYYDVAYSPSIKRSLLQNTMRWYQIAGTKAAVEELAQTIFGNCTVEEWFEYGGEPYHFRVITNALAEPDNIEQFTTLLRSIKNVRSHLDSVSIHRIIHQPGNHSGGVAMTSVLAPPIRCTR